MTTTHTIDPRSAPHSVAVAARNAAIVEALKKHFHEGSLNARAKSLAAALKSYRATVYWPDAMNRREPPEGSSPRAAALHEIIRLDRGRVVCVDSIKDIAKKALRKYLAETEGVVPTFRDPPTAAQVGATPRWRRADA